MPPPTPRNLWKCENDREDLPTFSAVIFPVLSVSSVQFSCSVVSDPLQPHESQHARPPCPSPTPGVHSDSRPSSQWCHPAISSSVIPFFSCPQSLPASESFPMSQLFEWGGQSIGASALASVLPNNTQVYNRNQLRKNYDHLRDPINLLGMFVFEKRNKRVR